METSIEKIIYHLTIADLQTVANDALNRNLTETEIKILESKIGDYMDWYGAIQLAIWQNISNHGTDDATNNGNRTSIKE
jgi:hypothetical protein